MFRWSFAGYFFFGYCCVAVLGASPLISSVCCRARQKASSSLCLATHGRASPVLPRVSVAALHGAARAAVRIIDFLCRRAPWCRACGRALVSSPVPPRSMVPRVRQNASSSSCAAAPHGAARAAERRVFACAAALHGAARGTTHRVFALLPRGGRDCYKRAARYTVGVSCSTAVVEVGRRRRIDVEVSRSTAVVKSGSTVVVVSSRSRVGEEFYVLPHVSTYGRTGCAHSRTGCTYGRPSSGAAAQWGSGSLLRRTVDRLLVYGYLLYRRTDYN